ncbi:hypothetical protein ABIE61_000338 [Marinobacterium sp. MBR-111]|uniref:hypothetical protein n=1 Tax=Marinobacterium sp. MBR-111 TaxID=3156463 RepID=UPI00339912AE
MNSAAMIDFDETVFSTSAHTMHTDLMGVVINTCKALPNVWQKMNEEQQQDFIDSIDRQIKELVTSCVKTIAADDRPFVLAKVDQVVFKGGIEAKLKIERDAHQEGAPSGAHELADNTGENGDDHPAGSGRLHSIRKRQANRPGRPAGPARFCLR